ncbi:MAG: hypothetical protein WBA68_07315 [Alteraurantiacibacter sp.]
MHGLYDGRWGAQAALSILVIVIAAGALWIAWRQWPGWRDRNLAGVWLARWATLGFAPLMLARLVSWHPLDRLLYTGPVRLNWVSDIGLTGACALGIGLFLKSGRR